MKNHRGAKSERYREDVTKSIRKGVVVAPPSREEVGEVLRRGVALSRCCVVKGRGECRAIRASCRVGKLARVLVFRMWKLPQIYKLSERREEKFQLLGERGGNDG